MSPRAVLRAAGCAWRAGGVVLHLLAGVAVVHGLFRWWERWPPAHAERKRNAVVQWWARRLCRLFRVQLRIRGVPAPGTALYVANHVSWLDIPCLLALIDATFVAKQEVARWPVVGGLAGGIGTIFLARGEGQTRPVAERMTWHLVRSRSVILFPEGTTSDGAAVRHFHSRLFQAAILARTPVQPIAIRYIDEAGGASRVAPFIGDDNLLRHVWRVLGQERLVAQVHLSRPCAPGTDRRALARQAQTCVGGMLGGGIEAQAARARP